MSQTSGSLRSRIPFRHSASGRVAEALGHAHIFATSQTFGWQGLYAEVGENDGWTAQDLTIHGHYVAINRAKKPLRFEVLSQGRWEKVAIAPRALWVQAAEVPFTFRVAETARWGGLVLDSERLRAATGVEPAVTSAIGLEDPVLAALVEAVVAEVLRGGSSGQLFAEALLLALGTQLVRLFGDARKVARGGLTQLQMRRLEDYIDRNLTGGLGITDLAGVLELSPFHFARTFKQATGQTPHRFVIERRLERARRYLADTRDPIATIAQACGFADQAHLARLMRRQFGLSPSALRQRDSG